MSAFVVSKKHIDAVVQAAAEVGVISPADGTDTGRMLIKENVASVSYRYGDKDLPGPTDNYWLTEYVFPVVTAPRVTGPGVEVG